MAYRKIVPENDGILGKKFELQEKQSPFISEVNALCLLHDFGFVNKEQVSQVCEALGIMPERV